MPALFLLLTSISVGPTYPVYATGGSNETAVTQAPSGASVGPADNGANVTTTSDMQSACLPQNATTATVSLPVNGSGGANATTTNTHQQLLRLAVLAYASSKLYSIQAGTPTEGVSVVLPNIGVVKSPSGPETNYKFNR